MNCAVHTSCDQHYVHGISVPFMIYGLPRVMTSDQGSEINNSLDMKLMEMLG